MLPNALRNVRAEKVGGSLRDKLWNGQHEASMGKEHLKKLGLSTIPCSWSMVVDVIGLAHQAACSD